MKLFLTSLLTFIAISAQAKTEYIACTDLRADEYNILVVLENSVAQSYSTLEEDFKSLFEIPRGSTQLDVTYLREMDTNFSYSIALNEEMISEIVIQAMVSGNDADNYHWQPNDTTTVCHLLKAQPQDAIIRPDNYIHSIPIKK